MDNEAPMTIWMLSGFQAVLVLWAWGLAVVLHAAWRSVLGPEQAPIRPSGPTR
jgi:hypothetical protein